MFSWDGGSNGMAAANVMREVSRGRCHSQCVFARGFEKSDGFGGFVLVNEIQSPNRENFKYLQKNVRRIFSVRLID